MTDDKKHDDKDRKKVSDEEMEDVAGGVSQYGVTGKRTFILAETGIDKKKGGDKKPPPLPNQSDGMSL